MSAIKNFAIALVLFFSFGACSEGVELTPKLTGTWQETIKASPQGMVVVELKFMANTDSFSYRINHYGIYQGQPVEMLSAWSEFKGNVTQTPTTLVFLPYQRTSWDSFFPGTAPVTRPNKSILFKNCTYLLDGNRLILNYVSFPNDAPVATQKIFFQKI